MKKRKVPDLLAEIEFTVSPEYNPIKFVLDTNELTVVQNTTEGEEVSVLDPKQALSLAAEIIKAYGQKTPERLDADNVVFLDFSKNLRIPVDSGVNN